MTTINMAVDLSIYIMPIAFTVDTQYLPNLQRIHIHRVDW